MQEAGGVKQVHTDDAERFLLQAVFVLEHPHMNQNLAVVIARMGLILDAHPAVALVGALKVPGRNGVRENEERRCIAAHRPQAFQGRSHR
jgi:hypothetical protein